MPQAHGKSYGTAAEPMRTEHVRSSLAPAGLAVQTSTFNALDSSDVGNAATNLSAKTRTRLLWATRHTGGVYHRPSLQSHSGAKETRVLEFPFSGWPCGDQGRQRRIDSCHDGAAPSLIASSGLGILRQWAFGHRQRRENRDGGAGPSQSKKFPIMTGALAKGRLDNWRHT